MKPLKPSHREHKRYLMITGKDASMKSFDEAVLAFVGILGYAKASPMLIKSGQNRIIVSINRSELEKVRASLMLSGKDIRVEKVSGIIKKL